MLNKSNFTVEDVVKIYKHITTEAIKIMISEGCSIHLENGGSKERKKNVFHPSTSGYCPRKLFFKDTLGKTLLDEIDETSSRIFMNGHLLHAKYAAEASYGAHYFNNGRIEYEGVKSFNVITSRHGKLVVSDNPKIYDEVTLDDKEHNIYGHCDLLCKITFNDDSFVYFVVENKTSGSNSYGWISGNPHSIASNNWYEYTGIYVDSVSPVDSKKSKPFGPNINHYAQGQMYMNLVSTTYNIDCDFSIIMYENKNNSNYTYFGIKKSDKIIDMLLEKIDFVNQSVDKLLSPISPTKADITLGKIEQAMKNGSKSLGTTKKIRCKNCGAFNYKNSKPINTYKVSGYISYNICTKCNERLVEFKCNYCDYYNNGICLNEMILSSYMRPLTTPLTILNNMVINRVLFKYTPLSIFSIISSSLFNRNNPA